uniref:Core protein VP7 n=1 Tax=Bukakata virus TaxID=2547355 RepID=A0A482A8M9_9REOV|nr:VP7 [Bukakata virus]
MDAVHARALSFLEAAAAVSDVRTRRDAQSATIYSAFATRYNTTTPNILVSSPLTVADRRNIFYASLDIVYSVLNINSTLTLDNYTQNAQTIAILAREDIPYTTRAYRTVVRARVCASAIGNTREELHPYADLDAFSPAGTEYGFRPGQAITIGKISTREAEVHMQPGGHGDVARSLRPAEGDTTRMQFVWQAMPTVIANGGFMQCTTDVTVLVGGEEIEPGRTFWAYTTTDIHVRNNSAVMRAHIRFTCIRYFRATAPRIMFPGMESDIATTYLFYDDTWAQIRTYILREVGLPSTAPTVNPIMDARRALTYALLARLMDVYISQNPELPPPEIFMNLGIQARLTRALDHMRGGQ